MLLSSQPSTLAQRFSAFLIEETGKLVFKLALIGSGPTFTLVTSELSVAGVSPEVLQRVFSQASTANGRIFNSSFFCSLKSRGVLFCGFPVVRILHVVFSLTRSVSENDATPSYRSLCECM